MLRAHEAMHESLQHVGKLLGIVTKGMDSCKGFGKHRKEAVEKIGREWQTLMAQALFLRTRGVPGPAEEGTASTLSDGAGKKRAREDSDAKSPERPKRSKKNTRPGTATLQERGGAMPSEKAAEAAPSGPNDQPMDWQVVEAKKKKGKGGKKAGKRQKGTEPTRREPLASRPRTDSILVRVKPGTSYSEAVRQLKSKVQPDASGVEVRSFREMKDGAVLVKLRKGAGDRMAFKADLESALGSDGEVRDLTARVTLEVVDLDPTITKEEVIEGVKRECGVEPRGVHVFPPNRRQQVLVVFEVEDSVAATILRKGRLKIGWINARVRERLMVPRCFRCLGYGHRRRECSGVDRHDHCNKCGSKGHQRKTCPADKDTACFLCSAAGHQDAKHLPGSGTCRVFRDALTARRSENRTV